MMNAAQIKKAYAGNPHAGFGEYENASDRAVVLDWQSLMAEMRKLLIAIMIAGVSIRSLAQWYDPNNPNPTQHDVLEAERNAQNHMQRSVEVSGWDSIREQEKANRARQDADEMRGRMWDNERRERVERNRQEEVHQDNCGHGFQPAKTIVVPAVANQVPRKTGQALKNEAAKMMRYVKKNRRAIDVELRKLDIVKWQYLIKMSNEPILDAWFELKGYGGGGAFRLKEYANLERGGRLLSPVELAKELLARYYGK